MKTSQLLNGAFMMTGRAENVAEAMSKYLFDRLGFSGVFAHWQTLDAMDKDIADYLKNIPPDSWAGQIMTEAKRKRGGQ